jgi:hypothetical protein
MPPVVRSARSESGDKSWRLSADALPQHGVYHQRTAHQKEHSNRRRHRQAQLLVLHRRRWRDFLGHRRGRRRFHRGSGGRDRRGNGLCRFLFLDCFLNSFLDRLLG